MQEADFAFDEAEWLATKDEKTGGDEEVVTEVLKEVEVTSDMGPEERYNLLQARYPEFDYLVEEFRELRPLLETLQKEAEGKPAKSLPVVKAWVLGCYVAALASYFAILTSPTRDGDESKGIMNPSELRDHEVMQTLMECREAWLKVKSLRPAKGAVSAHGMLSPPEEGEEAGSDVDMLDDHAVQKPKKAKKLSKEEIKANKKKKEEEAKKAKAVEQSLAELTSLLQTTKKAAVKASVASKAMSTAATSGADSGMDDNRSDFGEEEELDARTAAEKAKRKKSLRFYTSQIVQKANKRQGAGRDAGGDMDIPYRERLVRTFCFSFSKTVLTPTRKTVKPASTPKPSGAASATASSAPISAATRATTKMPKPAKSATTRTPTTTKWSRRRPRSGRTSKHGSRLWRRRARGTASWKRRPSGRTASGRSRGRSRRTKALRRIARRSSAIRASRRGRSTRRSRRSCGVSRLCTRAERGRVVIRASCRVSKRIWSKVSSCEGRWCWVVYDFIAARLLVGRLFMFLCVTFVILLWP